MIEKPFNWEQMRRLLQYILPYKKQLIPVIIATIIGTLTRVTIPFLIGYAAIDLAIAGKNAPLLITVTAVILALYILQMMMNRYRIKHMNIIATSDL